MTPRCEESTPKKSGPDFFFHSFLLAGIGCLKQNKITHHLCNLGQPKKKLLKDYMKKNGRTIKRQRILREAALRHLEEKSKS